MLAGLLGTAAAQGALFTAPNAATMALAAIALSATATMVPPAASATLADHVEPARRREAFALIGWAVNIGTAVAGILGGYLAAHGYWMLFAAAVNAGLVVALQPLATTFLARFPRTPVMSAGGALIVTGIALTGLAHSPAAYAATVAIWSVGEVVGSGIPNSLIANLAPADAVGRYQGAFNWAWGVARFLALAAGTTVYTLGPAFLWWGTLAVGAAATAGVAALGPAIDRRSGKDH
jgi:MFS family permease